VGWLRMLSLKWSRARGGVVGSGRTIVQVSRVFRADGVSPGTDPRIDQRNLFRVLRLQHCAEPPKASSLLRSIHSSVFTSRSGGLSLHQLADEPLAVYWRLTRPRSARRTRPGRPWWQPRERLLLPEAQLPVNRRGYPSLPISRQGSYLTCSGPTPLWLSRAASNLPPVRASS
jgi:hypothetical protein